MKTIEYTEKQIKDIARIAEIYGKICTNSKALELELRNPNIINLECVAYQLGKNIEFYEKTVPEKIRNILANKIGLAKKLCNEFRF